MKLTLLLAHFAVASAAVVSYSNTRRYLFDTDGKQIDAYGSKVSQFSGGYYLYGNSFSTEASAYGVKAYRSADLVNWQSLGNILSPALTQQCAMGIGGCGRPHMLYNAAQNRYVLWLNVGSSGYVVATASSPNGPFEALPKTAAIDPKFAALQPADFSIESNGTHGYLVFSALNFRIPDAGSLWPPIAQTLHISPLTDDFTSTTGTSYPIASAANDLVDNETESPDLAFVNGQFYVAASNTCGYCNGSIGLLYRSATMQGPWTREIIAADSCQGQVEGLLPLTNPKTGRQTLVWHSTTVPGGPRIGFGGHIFQPLSFKPDGSVNNLNCDNNAAFKVNFTPGLTFSAGGAATSAGDATPADAVYTDVCDSDQFDLYQTWTASKTGTLKSVSINVAKALQTVPLAVTVFTNFTRASLIQPKFKWQTLGSTSFNASQLTFTFDTATVTLSPPVKVNKGQALGFAFTQQPDLARPYCHLEFQTTPQQGFDLFQRGSGQNSPRGLRGERSVVYERMGKSMKFFATYA